MKEILLGTHNRHKAKEILDLLADLQIKVRTLNDFPLIPPTVEDGQTLEENALKKARDYSAKSALFTMADDTGLEVTALNGAPGVYSARFAGETCSYLENNKKLLELLSQKKDCDRSATFRCVIACVDPTTGFERMVEGKVEGVITEEIKGTHGFGYDPIFYVPSLKKTLAEMNMEEKNKISHRALALKKMKEMILEFQRVNLCQDHAY